MAHYLHFDGDMSCRVDDLLLCIYYIVAYTLYLQVGGFLQRIDYVRKHAFAVMSILKNEQGQFPIRCASCSASSGCASLEGFVVRLDS